MQKAVVFLLFIGSFLALQRFCVASDAIVKNGSFEEISTSGEVLGWKSAGDSILVLASEENAFDGNRSLRLDNSGFPYFKFVESDTILIQEKYFYVLGANFFVESGEVEFSVDYYDNEKLISTESVKINRNLNWKKKYLYTNSPEGSLYLKIRFSIPDTLLTKANVDLVSFISTNNPGFEYNDIEGNITGWTRLTLENYQSVVSGNDRIYMGRSSYLLMDPFSSDSASVRSESIVNISPGQEYMAKVMMYLESGIAGVRLEFWNGSNLLVVKDKLSSAQGYWQSLNITAIAPEGADRATILLFTPKKANAQVYFDCTEICFIGNSNYYQETEYQIPDEWTKNNEEDTIYSTLEKSFGQDYNLRLEGRNNVSCSSSPVSCRNTGVIFPIWVKCYNSSGTAGMSVEFYNFSGEVVGYDYSYKEASDNWQILSLRPRIPNDACYAKITLNYSSGNSSYALFSKITQNEVINIYSDKQLFIDDYIIENSTANRLYHEAEKDSIIFTRNFVRPWESKRVGLYGSVLNDDGVLRMWYRGVSDAGEKSICYAEVNEEGSWSRKDVNLIEYPGFPQNNIIRVKNEFDFPLANIDIASVVKVGAAYRMLLYEINDNIYSSFESLNGFDWTPVQRNCIDNKGSSFSDVCTMAYDDRNEEFITSYKVPYFYTSNYFVRQHFTSTSSDLANFEGVTYQPGLSDQRYFNHYSEIFGQTSTSCVESYGVGLFPYFGTYIGFNWLFYIKNKYGNAYDDGPIEPQLVFSRDLNSPWQIPETKSILPLGGPADWDKGMIFTANTPLVTSDKFLMYYSGWDNWHSPFYTKNCNISCASWRLDGFVSLHSEEIEEIVETKLLSFEGRSLVVNADASNGRILVSLADEWGEDIPGYSFYDCDQINVSDVRRTVTWAGKNDLTMFEGEVIRLRFLIENADLYSFQFTDSTEVISGISKKDKDYQINSDVNSNIVLYPNPAENYFRIKGLNYPAVASVYSMTNQLVGQYDIDSKNDDIYIGNLPNATYMVIIEANSETFSRRLVKNE